MPALVPPTGTLFTLASVLMASSTGVFFQSRT